MVFGDILVTCPCLSLPDPLPELHNIILHVCVPFAQFRTIPLFLVLKIFLQHKENLHLKDISGPAGQYLLDVCCIFCFEYLHLQDQKYIFLLLQI